MQKLILFFLWTLTGCSTRPVYNAQGPKNFYVNVQAVGTLLTSESFQIEFYELNEKCEPKSLGGDSLSLKDARSYSLPAGSRYLVRAAHVLKGFLTLTPNSDMDSSTKGYSVEFKMEPGERFDLNYVSENDGFLFTSWKVKAGKRLRYFSSDDPCRPTRP